MRIKNHIIKIILIADFIVLVFAGLNFSILMKKAGLPPEYLAKINSFSFDVNNINKGQTILEFDNKIIDKPGLLDFYLLYHKQNDIVRIKSIQNSSTIERTLALPLKLDMTELMIMAIVTLFYFFTGIYILLTFKSTAFSYVLHMVTIATAVMVMFDWGNFVIYPMAINFILFLLFDISIFLVPTLFLHFSFLYPRTESRYKMLLLGPFYIASITFISISFINLFKIFFLGINVNNTNYLAFHTYISDMFLVAGLILTVAKLEHSALTISNVLARKKIYWALLGISFGPLVYVFLRLMPRLILGYELVSQSFLNFTIIIAPIMLLISVTRKN